MTDPAHGWMILWNFSVKEGTFCMTQTDQRTLRRGFHYYLWLHGPAASGVFACHI
jgi:hypothetical protein